MVLMIKERITMDTYVLSKEKKKQITILLGRQELQREAGGPVRERESQREREIYWFTNGHKSWTDMKHTVRSFFWVSHKDRAQGFELKSVAFPRHIEGAG